jgi:hypothetical protein
MRAGYRVTPFLAWLFSLVILTGSGVLLGLTVRDTVRHVTADDQPATITDVGDTTSRISTNNRRQARTITFRLADGTEHAASARKRWFWWPAPGDTIHVHQDGPDSWEISEEFSWVRTLGFTGLLLLPWLVALAKVWEWAEKRYRPEKHAEKERRHREKMRRIRDARSGRRRG